MAAIGWNNVNYSPVSVNPSSALNASSSAAKSLVDANIQEQKLKEIVRRQDFAEAAPERARLLEQQQFNLGQSRAKAKGDAILSIRDQLVEQSRQGFNFSDNTLATLENNPVYQRLPNGVAKAQYRADALHQVKSNENQFINKSNFGKLFKDRLIQEGYAGDADASVNRFNNRVFPTGDPDVAKMQIDALGNPTSDIALSKIMSGSGASLRNNQFNVSNAIKEQEFADNFYAGTQQSESTLGNLFGTDTNPTDIGSNNLYADKLKSFIGTLSDSGIHEVNAIKALQSLAIKDGVLADGYEGINTGNLGPDQFKKIIDRAKSFQNLSDKSGFYGGNSGVAGLLSQFKNDRATNVNRILSGLSNTGVSQKDRSAVLSNKENIEAFAKKYDYTLLPGKKPVVDKTAPKIKQTPAGNGSDSVALLNGNSNGSSTENTADTNISPKPSKYVEEVKQIQKENKLPSKTSIQKTARLFEQSSVEEKKHIISKLDTKSKIQLMNNVDTSISYGADSKQAVKDLYNLISNQIDRETTYFSMAFNQDHKRLNNLGEFLGDKAFKLFGDSPEDLKNKRYKKSIKDSDTEARFNKLLSK